MDDRSRKVRLLLKPTYAPTNRIAATTPPPVLRLILVGPVDVMDEYGCEERLR
jgi:hypothetical protein